jgi:L-ascorbate metabolism protein UlaG (beta-lactamase superfamily)
MTTLRYLGHACFMVTNEGGKTAVIDPYLNANPHRAIKAEELKSIDLILVTHGGFDHLGDAFEIQGRTGAKLWASVDVIFAARKAGLDNASLFPMVSGARRSHAGFTVQAVEARHVSIVVLPDEYISGQPLGYVVWPDGEGVETSLYHTGDTSIFSDMKLIGELYRPRLALVGVGGDPDLPHEMSPYEASMAAYFVGAAGAIPMHYAPGSGDAEAFRDRLKERAPAVIGRIMEIGETVDLPLRG